MSILSLPPSAGTSADVAARLRSLLPSGWFADSTPILNTLLGALGSGWSTLFAQLSYVQYQTRVATATDIFLDLIAQDYFPLGLPRSAGEPDDSYRNRIQRGILPPRATRTALSDILVTLTSRPPSIFEPTRLQDTGAYNTASTLAYGTVGGYGSTALPFQFFVTAYRPVGTGVAYTNGYSTTFAGYGVGPAQYTTLGMAASTIHDSDLIAAIAASIPVAVTAWMRISN